MLVLNMISGQGSAKCTEAFKTFVDRFGYDAVIECIIVSYPCHVVY
jgi:hypothetical protein